MAYRIAFYVFRICLMNCAALALGAIWFGEHVFPPAYYQATASIFVIGLASFLFWFSHALMSIRSSIPQ